MSRKEAERYIPENLFEGILSFRTIVDISSSSHNNRRITKVYYSKEKLEKSASEFSYIKAKSYELGFQTEIVPRNVIDEMTIGNTHGGIAFECSERSIESLRDITLLKNGFYVMLDGIEDPYNFGYALRSVYASGANGIILAPRNWMSAAGVVCRSSAGASELLDMAVCENKDDLKLFKENGYRIICADTENSISVFDADLSRPLLLIVGGEKRGISSGVREYADQTVKLDYGRPFEAALSAASAASILAFEVFRYGRNK